MDKDAGIRDIVGKVREVARKAGKAVKGAPGAAKRGVQALDKKVREQQEGDPRGGTTQAGAVGHMVQGLLKEHGHKLPKSLQPLARKARVHLRMAQHEARVDPKTLPSETQDLARESGARIFEQGRRSPIMRKIGPLVSRYEPMRHKVVIGGGAKNYPNVTKHELGHSGGFAKKHPGVSVAATTASRAGAPVTAEVLARLGKKRAAQVVHGVGQAGTIGEEARAWMRGVGPDVKKSIKEKGVVKGILSKETASKVPGVAGGMGSYIRAAVKGHKRLGQIADKANMKKMIKKGQAIDPAAAQMMGMPPIMMIPPEYIQQMQAQFGEYEEPSVASQMVMPAALVGGGIGLGYGSARLPEIKAALGRTRAGQAAGKGYAAAGKALSGTKDRLMSLFKGGSAVHLLYGFVDELEKIGKKMPHFTEQDRPEGVKKIYRALKKGSKSDEMRKRYGKNWKEVAARIAARQGKRGKQHQGPPYKGPLGGKKSSV